MRIYLTEIRAIDPMDGQLKIWAGPEVPGTDQEDAQRFCDQNGLGYCVVVGEKKEEIHVVEILWEFDFCLN